MNYSASYSLKEVKSSTDPAFAAAIAIYVKYTAPGLRTNTNEIAHWVDHYNTQYDDRFHVCAFYVNRKVAGYCELVFLKEQALVVIDYMTIDPQYRGGLNVFFEFVEHIRSFIQKQFPTFEYVLVEVAPLKDDQDNGCGLGLMRLLKMRGFGVVDAPYIQPQLGFPKPDTELTGAMLIFPKPLPGSLPKATYLSLVKAVYFQHYVRWYGVHGEEYARGYEASVKKLYQRVEAKVRSADVIVNGLKHFPEPVSTGVVEESAPKIRDLAPMLVTIFLCLALVLALGRFFNLDTKSVILALLAALVMFFAAASVINKRAAATFKELTKLLKPLFGRTK